MTDINTPHHTTTDGGYTPAPLWRRAAARVIDLGVCVPLTFACLLVVFPVTAILIPFMSDDAWSSLAAFLCYFSAFALVEYFLLRRRSGQTLGKGLMGLRVIPEPTQPIQPTQFAQSSVVTGAPVGITASSAQGTAAGISARSALLRMGTLIGPLMATIAVFYIAYEPELDGPAETGDAIATFFLVIWLLTIAASTVAALVDRNTRRGIHDRVAGTRVVRAPRRGIKAREDFKMLVPGRVNLEKQSPLTAYPQPAQDAGLPEPYKRL